MLSEVVRQNNTGGQNYQILHFPLASTTEIRYSLGRSGMGRYREVGVMTKRFVACGCTLVGSCICILAAYAKSGDTVVGTGLEVADYKKVCLEVLLVDSTGRLSGIESVIRDKVELRLRSLGLTPVQNAQPGAGVFSIAIAAGLDPPDKIFGSMHFSYVRSVLYFKGEDLFSGTAAVWNGAQFALFEGMTKESLAAHPTDSYVDNFVNAYLKANEP